MKDKLNIEQLFKSKLEGMEQTPSPQVWKQTSRALRRKEFFKFNTRRFNIYNTLGLILLSAALTHFLSPEDTKKNVLKHNNRLEETITTPSTSLRDNELTEKNTSTTHDKSALETIIQEQSNEQSIVTSWQSAVGSQQLAIGSQQSSITKTAISKALNSKLGISAEVNTLIAYFTPSVFEGCAPLEVEFINSSVNAQSYQWNLGSESAVTSRQSPVASQQSAVSNSQSPVVTYDEPGTYIITMIAIGENGLQLSHSEQIIVHPI